MQELQLWENQIRKIEGLETLVGLQKLVVSSNQISKIEGFETLVALQALDLSNNQISKIEGFDSLCSLQELDLGYNQISEIERLEHLSSLQKLYLSHNQIKEIEMLNNLVNLHTLSLHNNKIYEIKALEKLTSLKWLNISFNQISEIKGLDKLLNLETLDLSENQIVEIIGLERLMCLKRLDLVGNSIEEIKGLDNLISLQKLYLIDNQIKEIKGLEKLTGLQSLGLSNNQINNIKALLPFLEEQIPIVVDADQLGWSTPGIYLYGNPLVNPPMDIVELGRDAVLRFFSEKLEATYEAKLLIVGEPEAGKTSLMNKMTDENYEIPNEKEGSTIGIQVMKWSFDDFNLPKPLSVNIWDFGGQEMQYLTHQFFLSSDALYVLLTSARKDFDNLDYWFNIISLLGKNESEENSEVIVVANEIKMKGDQVNKSFDIRKYEKLYPHLPFTFKDVNLATAADCDGRFASLLYLIKEKLTNLRITHKMLPIKWGIVRNQLKSSGKHYLTLSEYLAICKRASVDEKLAMDLTAHLHKIGEVVHFKTDDFIILNPKWAVDGVYSILKRNDIEKNGGHFTQEQVYEIWGANGYSYQERNLLLNLMTKDNFEVAYKILGGKDEYIAPQLLSLIQPDFAWDKAGALHFRYFYPFMPKGILTRLIVRLHDAIKYENGNGLVWRTGVVFDKMGCVAKVEETKIVTTGQQVITIEIHGYSQHRKLLLYEICRTIEGIHKESFSNINFERQIPCNCDHCKNLEEPGFFDYSEILDYINDEIDKIRCKVKVRNEVPINNLLGDIFGINMTYFNKPSYKYGLLKGIAKIGLFIKNDPFGVLPKTKIKKKIFISYSQRDARFELTNGNTIDFKAELETHLKQLKRLGLAETWSDTNLLAGDDWDEGIKRELEEADIILFLVSANLIGTDYVWDEEMPLAKFHKENKKTVLIPVILNPCLWTSIPLFSVSNAVPHKGVPVSSFNNREEAYDEITRKIKMVLEG